MSKRKIYLRWLFSLWIACLFSSVHSLYSTRKPPNKLHEHQAKYLECVTLGPWERMTQEIAKDVIYKLRQANTIQEKYKYTLSYELGTLAAGIQDTFEHMLQIYRKFNNYRDYTNETYQMSVALDAYHVIQGDYNQIRLEKQLFRQVKDKFEARREAQHKKLKKIGFNTNRMPKGKPNPKDFGDLKALMDMDEKTRGFGGDDGSSILSIMKDNPGLMGRRFAKTPNGSSWKNSTATPKGGLWKSAPIGYIPLT